MSKHTQEPWKVTGLAVNCRDIIGGEYVVATCRFDAMRDTPERREMNEANARLISAAPDLLAALEGLELWLRQPALDIVTLREMHSLARLALAKAGKGEI